MDVRSVGPGRRTAWLLRRLVTGTHAGWPGHGKAALIAEVKKEGAVPFDTAPRASSQPRPHATNVSA